MNITQLFFNDYQACNSEVVTYIYGNDFRFVLGKKMWIFRFAKELQKDLPQRISLFSILLLMLFLSNHRSQTFKERYFSLVKAKRKIVWLYWPRLSHSNTFWSRGIGLLLLSFFQHKTLGRTVHLSLGWYLMKCKYHVSLWRSYRGSGHSFEFIFLLNLKTQLVELPHKYCQRPRIHSDEVQALNSDWLANFYGKQELFPSFMIEKISLFQTFLQLLGC